MLALYIKNYKGIIPARSYLILGNLPEGSVDSTRFGLIDQSALIGKVVPVRRTFFKSFRNLFLFK